MEEKNDLMKNITEDNNNMKKYLIIGGAVFVIFVIGIVIAKFAFGTSKDNTQVILPPEPTSKTQKEAAALFNSINVEKSDDTTQNQKNNEVNNKMDDKKIGVEDVLAQKQINQNEQNNNVDEFKKPEPLTIEPVKPKVEPKKVEKKEKKSIKHKSSKNVTRNYYIQVAAVTRGEPSKKFLNLIKQNSFNYKIIEVNVKGRKIKRVLVGPFTAIEAKEALPKVKEKITSSAFIKKLK